MCERVWRNAQDCAKKQGLATGFRGWLAACKPRATREIQSRVPASLHNLEHFFTLSHTLPLHNSHLNTGSLIAKIQANLVRNKTNKMIDKIQPYKSLIMDSKESELIFMDIPLTQAEYLPTLTQTQLLIMPSYSLTSQLQWLIVDANLLHIPSFRRWYININIYPNPFFSE